MKITEEQKNILNSVKIHKNIKINAFAGTGKTTTLKLISNTYSNQRILYLAFNSAIKNEATKIFPNNTFVKTTHGLAYSAIKKHTNIDLTKLTNYRAIDISKKFDITYNQAIVSLKIFDAFCNSNHTEIKKDDLEHKTAKQMFDFMLINKMYPTHNFYLKYYQLLLKNGEIQQYSYDIIMLDEAQDTNDVTLDIFENLKANTKICVGDEHQQIYSFRGSKNALDKINFDKIFYLSCSFRFNSTIASYANILLENFKAEDVKISVAKDINKPIESFGFISRTNATLIAQIALRIKDKKPFVTIREPSEIFTLSVEVYYLLNNLKEKIKRNYFLKDFKNEDDLLEYANEVEDYELKSSLKLIKEYGHEVFLFKDISEKFYKAWSNKANVAFHKRVGEILFLTTAHTSKGLEWDSVCVADDFSDFADLILDSGYDSYKDFKKNINNISNQDIIDEFNLFYVAITRAKKVLIKDSENFHYILSKNIAKIVDARIKESKKDLKLNKNIKKVSKIQKEEKTLLRVQRNKSEGKLKNQGLKWKLEDKIKVKSLFNKNTSIVDLSNKLQRTTSAILAELYKSEVITKQEQSKLSQMLKQNIYNTSKSML